jgi:hypothetical protein
MTCLVAPLLRTMLVLCTVQTMPMSPLIVASSSRMSTLQDSKLLKVSSNNFSAGDCARATGCASAAKPESGVAVSAPLAAPAVYITRLCVRPILRDC